jgi:hypothetical protein
MVRSPSHTGQRNNWHCFSRCAQNRRDSSPNGQSPMNSNRVLGPVGHSVMRADVPCSMQFVERQSADGRREGGWATRKTNARGKRRGLQADMVAAKRKVWVMRGERARARECGEGTQTRVHRGKRPERSQASWRWVVEERAEAKGSGAAWCKHGCTDEGTPQRLTPWRDLRAEQIHQRKKQAAGAQTD